jgi:AraC-like DNA-binding protein
MWPVVATDILGSALQQLHVEGAIFFRSELTEPFSFTSRPLALVDQLRPGADRMTLFHIVARGACWVRGPDGQRHRADVGDVIVLPYGDQHTITGELTAADVSINDLLDPLPWSTLPTLRHGGGGASTELVCGYLFSEDPLFDPDLRALPHVLVVHIPEPAMQWVRASVEYSLTESAPSNASPSPLAVRLPEMVLTEVLRTHLASAPAVDHGWLAALHDPVLALALARLHGAPARHWTVAALAAEAAVSRSLLDERFRQLLGRSPIRYLAQWRMHLAAELLSTTDLPVAAVAHRVGYDAEEAFSRAFKRARGLAPTRWREQRNHTPGAARP